MWEKEKMMGPTLYEGSGPMESMDASVTPFIVQITFDCFSGLSLYKILLFMKNREPLLTGKLKSSND